MKILFYFILFFTSCVTHSMMIISKASGLAGIQHTEKNTPPSSFIIHRPLQVNIDSSELMQILKNNLQELFYISYYYPNYRSFDMNFLNAILYDKKSAQVIQILHQLDPKKIKNETLCSTFLISPTEDVYWRKPTMLHALVAIYSKQKNVEEFFSYLDALKPDWQTQDPDGKTLLFYADNHDLNPMCIELVKRKVDPHNPNSWRTFVVKKDEYKYGRFVSSLAQHFKKQDIK